MMRSFHWRWAGSAAVPWLALAVLSALLTAEARAGCNHPWVKRAGQSGSLVDRPLFDLSGQTAILEHESPQPADPPSPCAGGACSQIPNLPASSTVPIPTRAELWMDLWVAFLPPDPRSVGSPADHGRQQPVRFTIPIERPPRSSWAG